MEKENNLKLTNILECCITLTSRLTVANNLFEEGLDNLSKNILEVSKSSTSTDVKDNVPEGILSELLCAMNSLRSQIIIYEQLEYKFRNLI